MSNNRRNQVSYPEGIDERWVENVYGSENAFDKVNFRRSCGNWNVLKMYTAGC